MEKYAYSTTKTLLYITKCYKQQTQGCKGEISTAKVTYSLDATSAGRRFLKRNRDLKQRDYQIAKACDYHNATGPSLTQHGDGTFLRRLNNTAANH